MKSMDGNKLGKAGVTSPKVYPSDLRDSGQSREQEIEAERSQNGSVPHGRVLGRPGRGGRRDGQLLTLIGYQLSYMISFNRHAKLRRGFTILLRDEGKWLAQVCLVKKCQRGVLNTAPCLTPSPLLFLHWPASPYWVPPRPVRSLLWHPSQLSCPSHVSCGDSWWIIL